MAGKGDANTRVKKWRDYWSAPIWDKLKENKDKKNGSKDKRDNSVH